MHYPYEEEIRNGEKGHSTDGGTHAPLIVNFPVASPSSKALDGMVDFSDFLPTIADIAGVTAKELFPDIIFDGQSFWPQYIGKDIAAATTPPREAIFQFFYADSRNPNPASIPGYSNYDWANKEHGVGLGALQSAWAQNQKYKLYRDGSMYRIEDRHEVSRVSATCIGQFRGPMKDKAATSHPVHGYYGNVGIVNAERCAALCTVQSQSDISAGHSPPRH